MFGVQKSLKCDEFKPKKLKNHPMQGDSDFRAFERNYGIKS